MAKKGTLFEKAVADIIRSFDSTLNVVQGSWVVGPDGRRDRDVSFTGIAGGKPYKALIECKDFNPSNTGPVGIEYIDALDSKRRDLAIDFPAICSNAGFTEPAIAKARRVGIAVLGALRMGDHRIRFRVNDVGYFRKLTVKAPQIEVVIPLDESPPDDPDELCNIRYGGRLVSDWLLAHGRLFVATNRVVQGYWHVAFDMRRPTEFECGSVKKRVIRIGIIMIVTGAWYKHDTELDATSGLYDWVRKRVLVNPTGRASFSHTIDWSAGLYIPTPPGYVLSPPPIRGHEVYYEESLINMPSPQGELPAIEKLLKPIRLQHSADRLHRNPSDPRQILSRNRSSG